MKTISDLLSKFKIILRADTELKNIFIQILKKQINHETDPKKITYKNGVIYLNEKPIVKNEILIHKEKILTELNQLLLKKRVIDIK